MGDDKTVYLLAPSESGRLRELSLQSDEWNILRLIDGRRSIADIVASSEGEEEPARLHLAQLKLAGLIIEGGSVATETSSMLEQQIGRLAGMFESYLTEKKADEPETHNRISSIVTETIE